MTPHGRRALQCAAGRAAGCALLFQALPAAAAPWNVEPSLSFFATYQSNPQFYTDKTKYGSGELLTLAAPLDWNDGNSKVLLKPTLNAGLVQGATGLGQHNKTLDGSWISGFDRGSWRLNGSYAHLDIVGPSTADPSQFNTTGVTVSGSGDLGLTLHATERDSVDVDVTQSRNTYQVSTAAPSNYVDYRYSSVNVQYARTVNERTQLLTTLTGGEYVPTTSNAVSNDRSLQLGASRQLSETISVQGTFGGSQVSRSTSVERTSGRVYTFIGTWTHPTTSVTLSAKQFRQPGAFGDLSLVTDLRANWAFTPTERLTLSLSAISTRLADTALVNTYGGLADVTLSERNYVTGEANLSYRLTPQWRLDLQLSDGRVEFPQSLFVSRAASATSYGGFVSFTRVYGRTRLN